MKGRIRAPEWIERHYGHDPKKKTALTRLAEADQYLLTHPDATMDAYERGSLALACYFVAFDRTTDHIDGMPIYEALDAQSFNTSTRARKNIAFQGRLSGKVLELSHVKSWAEQCEKPLYQ